MVNTVVLEISVQTTVLFSECAIGMRRRLTQMVVMLSGLGRRSTWLRSGSEEGGNSRWLQRLRIAHAPSTRVPYHRRGSSLRLLRLLAILLIYPVCSLGLP